ncbi:MAG: hypothetical protein QM737_14420 [Ferruginibacter sp.]
MYKFLSLLFFCMMVQAGSTFAQTQKSQLSTTHDYYIVLSGIKRPADLEKIESSILKKEGVTFFMGDRLPVRYFTLKSVKPVSQEEFTSWIAELSLYKVEFYGAGIENKELAANAGKKFQKDFTPRN